MASILSVRGVSKRYASGHQALGDIDLDVEEGEIFALLGPNGAGKTTLISIICGIVNASGGTVTVDGHDIIRGYRHTRSTIGLVPQELATDMFERVIDTVSLSRGLFGKPRNDAYIEKILRDLSLWDKRAAKVQELSGGMKRRVMIAKALSHEPKLLFLDEPTAGVDVELRRDMWALVRQLRDNGATIILTTHYIEEAEDMADRIGVISKGELVLVEEKHALMKKLGRKVLHVRLSEAMSAVPAGLADWKLALRDEGHELEYEFDTHAEDTGVSALLARLGELGIGYKDLNTEESSLEDIFVSLVHAPKSTAKGEAA
jgi:ABC-2 type transport system ATP-binding protein